MALLSTPNTTPPGGFVFLQKETQTRLESRFLSELAKLVADHRAYKGLPRATEDEARVDIERQICADAPPGVCHGEQAEDYSPFNNLARHISLDKIESFSFAAFEFLKSGMKIVDVEEQDRRVEICRGCKFNYQPSACSCTPLWAFLNSIVPKSRHRDNLFVCGICGCALQAKIVAPDGVVKESNRGRGLRFPEWCWQKSLT
jgi:hypothetical protein